MVVSVLMSLPLCVCVCVYHHDNCDEGDIEVKGEDIVEERTVTRSSVLAMNGLDCQSSWLPLPRYCHIINNNIVRASLGADMRASWWCLNFFKTLIVSRCLRFPPAEGSMTSFGFVYYSHHHRPLLAKT